MARKVKLSIKIGNQEIGPIDRLTIQQQIGAHHLVELRLPLEETIAKSLALFQRSKEYIGNALTISIFSHTTPHQLLHAFRGIVTETGISRTQGVASQLMIRAKSPTILLEAGPYCRSYSGKTIKQIAEKVLQPYGDLTTQLKPQTTRSLPYCVQYKETNFQFLHRLAGLHGEWFFYDGQVLRFGRPTAEIISLQFGTDLKSLDLGLQLRPAGFEVTSYDYFHHQIYRSSAANFNSTGLEHDEFGKIILEKAARVFNEHPSCPTSELIASQEELNELVRDRKAARLNDSVIFSAAGDQPKLQLGATIKIEDRLQSLGDVSKFLITAITHTIHGNENYSNHFEAIPSTVTAPPQPNTGPAPAAEMQIAQIKDNADPDGLGRVRVQFPWQDPNEWTPWIRVAADHSGSSMGFYFIPEKGEEVIVGFEHDNPEKPYVIGSTYHGKARPKESDLQNQIKSIVTKAGNVIRFFDKQGQQEIRIATPGNTNEIVLTVQDGGSITLRSIGRINLEGREINIRATEDLRLEGRNVQIKANQELKQQADSAEIKSSANVKIQGSAIYLN